MKVREDFCDRNRVGDVRLTTQALLAIVSLCAHLIGGNYAFEFLFRKVPL